MRIQLFIVGILAAATGLWGCSQPPAPEPSEYKTSSDTTGGGAPAPTDTKSGSSGDQTTNQEPQPAPAPAKEPSAAEKEQACVSTGFYFDLVTRECTKRPLVKVTCTIENITNPDGSDFLQKNPGTKSDFLADNQKLQVKELFENNLKGYQLRYCVDDSEQYTLVAVKEENNKNVVQDIDVPK